MDPLKAQNIEDEVESLGFQISPLLYPTDVCGCDSKGKPKDRLAEPSGTDC